MIQQKIKLAYRKFFCSACNKTIVRLTNLKSLRSMCDSSGYKTVALKLISPLTK